MITILIFIAVIAFLVFVHELGHFLSAKYFNVPVDEFAIGFPPRLFSFKRNETTYAINALPLGGYVKINEDPAEPSSFHHIAWWKKIIVLLAGVIANILIAWILISITFMFPHYVPVDEIHTDQSGETVVIHVAPDTPAYTAGIQPGDRIIARDNYPIQSFSDMESTAGSTVLTIGRGDSIEEITLVPTYSEEHDRFIIGISLGFFEENRNSFFTALGTGALTTYEMTGVVIHAFGTLISDSFKGQADIEQLSGPIGIAQIVGESHRSGGILSVIMLTALISLNLAVLNMIPFPALDGGRILIVLIETITKRKIPRHISGMINGIGFLLLIVLFIVITFFDISKLVS